MPTPDRAAGVSSEEGVLFEPVDPGEPTTASGPGSLVYDGVSGAFRMEDAFGSFDPRSGTGLSSAQHQALRQLIHFIDDGPANGFPSGAYKEIVYSGILVMSETWYENNTKVKKLVEFTAAYTGVFPNTETWSMYDSDGVTVLATVTDTIVYSGVFETSRTRVIA